MTIFCQSTADIKYVLYLYEKNKCCENINIIVVNVKNNYRYLKSLDLNAKLEFIPLINSKNILKYLVHIFKLRYYYHKLFSHLKNDTIYFFSKNYDYVSIFFIEKLLDINKIYFIDINKINFKAKMNLKNKVKSKIIFFLYGIKVFYDKYSYIYILSNKIDKIDIEIDMSVLKNYLYTPNINKNKKNLLYLDANNKYNPWFKNYEKDLEFIMDFLTQHYSLYVKVHPRTKYSSILDNYNVTFIKKFIPSELINLKEFDRVVGIESTSIANCNNINKFSLINCFQYKDKQHKEYIIKYLKKLMNSEIVFIEDITQL
jgi:hypothetical protein